MKTIILASASPRRKELLRQIGLKFRVEPGDYEEERKPDMPPRELAEFLSAEKAKIAAKRHRKALIIAADTLISFKDMIMGKANSRAEARKMLKTLSGETHSVITGFTIVDTETGKSLTRSVETKVYFKKLSREEIEAYINTGEPLGKAGAYAIQGLGALLVERIEGDYSNVVGLPLFALAESLKEFGISIL